MLNAFFILHLHSAQYRSHPLEALVRCEDERLVCVGKLQHRGLTQLQLEFLKCLHLFVVPLPQCIHLEQLVEGVGNGTEMQHELAIVGEES